jgi:hypothetical protein
MYVRDWKTPTIQHTVQALVLIESYSRVDDVRLHIYLARQRAIIETIDRDRQRKELWDALVLRSPHSL